MRYVPALVFVVFLYGCGAEEPAAPEPSYAPQSAPFSVTGDRAAGIDVQLDGGSYVLDWAAAAGASTGCRAERYGTDYSVRLRPIGTGTSSAGASDLTTDEIESGRLHGRTLYDALESGAYEIQVGLPRGTACDWRVAFYEVGGPGEPNADPLPATISDEGDGDLDNMTYKPIRLDAGDYALTYGPQGEDCRRGMVAGLIDPSGEDVSWGVESDFGGARGRLTYDDVAAGTYELYGSSDCDWFARLEARSLKPEASLPLERAGEASPDGEPMTESLRLASGDYTLEWSVEPAAGSTDECGVTISLFDANREYPNEQTGVSGVVVPPASGSVEYMLLVGDYDLFAYVGCPWEIRLDGEPWPED